MEKLVMGRRQEVTGWGPGQGWADKGGRLVQGVARLQGQRTNLGPKGQQEGLLPNLVSLSSPVSPRPPFIHSLIPVLCAGNLEATAGLAPTEGQQGHKTGKMPFCQPGFPDED